MTSRLFLVITALFALVAGSVMLASHKVAPPSHTIEKVISNARFFK